MSDLIRDIMTFDQFCALTGNIKMVKMTKLIKLSVILAAGLLSACSTLDKVKDVNLWPFGNGADAPRVYRPANSTEYLCEKGKKFYIRVLDNGANVWLML